MTDVDFTGPNQPCVGTPLYFSTSGVCPSDEIVTPVFFRSARVSTLLGGILVVVADSQGYNHACVPSELDRISED